MRAHDLLAPSRVGRPHGPKAHDGTIRTERVDAMWGTDLTSTLTGEGQASIFVTVDHCSTECVGIHAARRATRFEALEPLRQGVRACFGAFAEGVAGGLKLRHDHGSQFVADDYQRELAVLGIASSPAFVREPEGNGCVERFIRTLKENLLWVRRFDSIAELRLALPAFKRTYNHTWIVERHGYQTPSAVRAAGAGAHDREAAPGPAPDRRGSLRRRLDHAHRPAAVQPRTRRHRRANAPDGEGHAPARRVPLWSTGTSCNQLDQTTTTGNSRNLRGRPSVPAGFVGIGDPFRSD